MYNILEHKQAIAENIQKAFGNTPEDIEKAKWQIGEIRVDSRGIAHECYEYTAEGKPRLRRVRKNKGASTTSKDDNGGKKIYPLSLNDKKENNKKKFTENSFKNSFDSIISNISSIVDKVYVDKPVGRDYSTVDKTYKTSDWKNGVHIVGNDFYGKSELLQLDINKKGGDINTIQLRKYISNGMGSSYNNKPIGHVIVEVRSRDNYWSNFDITKENERKNFAELLNKNIKKYNDKNTIAKKEDKKESDKDKDEKKEDKVKVKDLTKQEKKERRKKINEAYKKFDKEFEDWRRKNDYSNSDPEFYEKVNELYEKYNTKDTPLKINKLTYYVIGGAVDASRGWKIEKYVEGRQKGMSKKEARKYSIDSFEKTFGKY